MKTNRKPFIVLVSLILAILAFAATALATVAVSVRLSVESGKIYAEVMADGKNNWSDDNLRVYYLVNESSRQHILKERTIKGEIYRERLLVTEVKKGEKIRVVIESYNSGDRIADSDSYPR